jgi:hypothetical protein
MQATSEALLIVKTNRAHLTYAMRLLAGTAIRMPGWRQAVRFTKSASLNRRMRVLHLRSLNIGPTEIEHGAAPTTVCPAMQCSSHQSLGKLPAIRKFNREIRDFRLPKLNFKVRNDCAAGPFREIP